MKQNNLQSISYHFAKDMQPITCCISYDPLPSLAIQALSEEDKRLYLDLLEKAQTSPKTACDAVAKLFKRHGDIPEIVNLYTYLLLQQKKIQQAEELIQESYQKNPEYLFAKINYADQCLRRKKIEIIPRIFPSFSLLDLCPDRSVFHFTEFRGFMVVMGFYHLSLRKKDEATMFYKAAFEADAAHPSVIALEKRVGTYRLFNQMREQINHFLGAIMQLPWARR